MKQNFNRSKVAVIGASGLVGREIIRLVQSHPFLSLGQVCASPDRIGTPFSSEYPGLVFSSIDSIQENSLVISALPSSVAHKIEGELAHKGCTVISNASAFRMDSEVPLVQPDVNSQTLLRAPKGIICIPNCVVSALTLALKPLVDRFGVSSVQVTTMQAISGAGRAHGTSLDIEANIIPLIAGEEQKIESEPGKILGAHIPISATALRVAVPHGHMASVSIKLNSQPLDSEVINAWNSYQSFCQEESLYSAASQPILYMDDPARPQPKRDVNREGGMGITLGRLRKCLNFDYKFVMLSHNLIQGAAGAAVLAAEAHVQMKKKHDENAKLSKVCST